LPSALSVRYSVSVFFTLSPLSGAFAVLDSFPCLRHSLFFSQSPSFCQSFLSPVFPYLDGMSLTLFICGDFRYFCAVAVVSFPIPRGEWLNKRRLPTIRSFLVLFFSATRYTW